MSSQTQPHRLLRMLLLVVATLAVVGVGFAIYVQYAQAPAERQATAPPIIRPTPPPPTSAPTTPASGMRVEGVPLPKGERTRINLYGSEGVQARLQLEVDAWEPIGQTGREFRLEKPTLRFRTPSGQLVNVTADGGTVEMARQKGENYDLSRGRFAGHVTVVMDRLDDTQRAALPPEERDRLTDDRKIQAELDDLIFDLEYARVESSGRIHAVLAEGEFEGRQLLLRYDEAGSRIEYLRLAEGGRIALRGLGRSFAITLPGAADAVEPGTPPLARAVPGTTQPATVAADRRTAAATQPDDGIPVFEPAAPKPARPRETVTYTAAFEGEVAVDQFEGQTQTGTLTTDRLAFLFDFGAEQRELARRTPGTPASGPADEASTTAPAERGGSLVVLTWKGPLVVDLLRQPGEVPADVYGKRLQITATGQEVRIADRQGAARCRKLVYFYETAQAWLYGEGDTPFTLDIGSGGHLVGRELAFDPRGQTATVLGPGLLSDERAGGLMRPAGASATGPAGAVSIAFSRQMNLALGKVDAVSPGFRPGSAATGSREYLQSAELLGDVVMTQESDSIAADRVEIGFRPPTEPGTLVENLESLRADGRVRMIQGDERITCRSITVAMGRDAGGRVVPTQADARGDVSAAQGSRAITATERMIVDLQSVPVEKPPFDLVQAKLVAARRGLNPDEIDWAAQREKYEREKKYLLGLRHLQGVGAVQVTDPDQGLHIQAQRLDCAFADGRRIDRGIVSGSAGQPANVEFADFGIMGREIEFDARTQWADVPGTGRMSFVSRKDLDGRALAHAVPMTVTWTDSMSFRGQENTAVFTGTVHAESKDSVFDCREMVLDFDDAPRTAASQPAAHGLRDWWLVQPFLSRFRAPERIRLDAPRVEKQLAYLSATGDVVGLTASYDDQTGTLNTRARIAGPRLAVNLRKQTEAMTIDDAGSLLIEDYRPRVPGKAGANAKMSPFGAAGENLPSQTFISWQGAMSFYGGSRVAVFEKEVELVYRSGSKLLLADGVLDQAALTRMRASPGGRDARLMAQQLNVQFLRKGGRDASSPSAAGVADLSGNEVGTFAATGGVYFEDSGVSVTCRTLNFDRERNLLQVLGTREEPAELTDQRHGKFRSIRGPTIYWERDTDRIEAPRSTIRVR